MIDRLSQLKIMLQKEPDDPFLHYGLALEYEKLGQSEMAINTLLQLVTLAPDYTATYYQLGRMLVENGRVQDGIGILENGVTVAQQQQDFHTLSELRSFLMNLELED